ncbi:DMT family transporter [Thiomicrorhabdus sp. ZW0627]|uniref:DMT family transporter n=1 Tax=Thiomicrorhabdus sp. ZW0627 TaxID=3039774 RepID=UPI002436AECB|nr:DMT family transporter [Thiomicrorhabdus sp. ZW0627]MDG6774832.1 DMT family transporter [Thiomicrorhabdus sp. ZW0627]
MKALFLLIVSGILAGGVFIAGKQAGGEHISPWLILFWQMAGGAMVVWLVSWPSRRFPVWNPSYVRYYLIGGLLGVSLPYVLAFTAMQQLQVGMVGLLTALSPVVTYAMARLLGLERNHPLRLLGLVIGFGGVAMLVMHGESMSFSGNGLYMLLALGIPIALAASNIYRSRFWPTGSEAMPLVIGMLTVQSIWLFFVNLAMGNFQDVITMDMDIGMLLFVLGLMAGASYLSSFNLLKVGGPVYLSQMGYVITAVTLLAGIGLWDERYEVRDWFSMGLILSGVLLTTLTQGVWRQREAVSPAGKR